MEVCINVYYKTTTQLSPGPEDYIGGTFNISLFSAAASVGCQDITIVPNNDRREERFSVELRFFMARVVAGQPDIATVVIQGE